MGVVSLGAVVRGVVFDLDDTLYPEKTYVASGFRAVARWLSEQGASRGIPSATAEQWARRLWQGFERGPRNRVFNVVLEQVGFAGHDDPAVIGELVSCYREHVPTLTLRPEVRELLETLGRTYRLGIITDGYLPSQRLKAETLGVDRLVDRVICTEQLGRACWKPSPEAFELYQREEGLSGPQCVYVADNPVKDFIAPNRLGWVTVEVASPDGVHPSPSSGASSCSPQSGGGGDGTGGPSAMSSGMTDESAAQYHIERLTELLVLLKTEPVHREDRTESLAARRSQPGCCDRAGGSGGNSHVPDNLPRGIDHKENGENGRAGGNHPRGDRHFIPLPHNDNEAPEAEHQAEDFARDIIEKMNREQPGEGKAEDPADQGDKDDRGDLGG